jgi:hypothetical protein
MLCEILVWTHESNDEGIYINIKAPTRSDEAMYPEDTERTQVFKALHLIQRHALNTIYEHLHNCGKCCPNEVLRRYLMRKDRPMELVFSQFAEIAIKHKRKFRSGFEFELNLDLVAELVIRSGDFWRLLSQRDFLTEEQFIRGVRYMLVDRFLGAPKMEYIFTSHQSERELYVVAANELYDIDNGPPPPEESFQVWLQEAVTIHKVINS